MDLPEEMLTSFAVGSGRMSLERTGTPDPGDGILLRVAYCGICGSDRRQLVSRREGEKNTMGHEVVGKVVATPPGAEELSGRMVGVAPRLGCCECSTCSRGYPNLCKNTRIIGYQVPGGFSQYMAVPPEAIEGGNIVPLPGEIDPNLGALAEPLSCVINGLELSSPGKGDSILIYGAGPMGQMFTIMSGEITRDICVVEPDRGRREFALSHGAAEVFTPGSREIPEAEIIIVACSSERAYEEAMQKAPPGGRVNLFGGLSDGVEINSNLIHYGQLTVHGTSGSTPGQFAGAMEALVRLPGLREVITDTVGFPDLENTVLSGPPGLGLHLKSVLDPWL